MGFFFPTQSHFASLFLLAFQVPTSVPPPIKVQSLTAYSAKVSWVPPTGDIRGLIDRYELKAYYRDYRELPPVRATFLANGNFTGKKCTKTIVVINIMTHF